METKNSFEDFLALSAVVTGFNTADLLGTGVGEQYYKELATIAGGEITGELLTTSRRILKRHRRDNEALERALRHEILSSPKLGPVARNIIKMWYLGQWFELPPEWRGAYGNNPQDVDHMVSGEAYQESLVWLAAGSHPAGAKQPGYATWSLAPIQVKGKEQGG